MSDFVNYLQHRVEDTKRKVKEAIERLNQAIAEREMLVADLAGYERALEAEMRSQGINVLPQPVQMPLNGTSNGTEHGETNKAEFVRQFVRAHADAGVTPNDIFKGFQDAGIPIKKPYVYSLVQRLQNQKPPSIRSRRRKWYPIPESEQSVDGTAEKTLP
jgi:hypothetical protein